MVDNSRSLTNQELLSSFAEELQSAGYDIFLGPLDESAPVNSLVVALENKEDALTLTAYFLGDLMRLAAGEGSENNIQDYLDEQDDFLVLYVQFPFIVQPEAFSDLARLLLMLNWSTHIGSFGLQEVQQIAYYRCVLPSLKAPLAQKIVSETIGSMAHYALLHFDLLKQVASGALSLSQALKALEEAGEKGEVFPAYDL